jgi:hypothetical protein
MKIHKVPKKVAVAILIGIPVGIAGYYVGSGIAQAENTNFASIRSVFGIDEATDLHIPTILAAAFLVFLSFVQTGMVLIARYNREFSRKSGIEAQLGDGKTGRASLLPLAWFHGANGVFILLLACATLWTFRDVAAVVAGLIGLTCSLVMAFHAFQVWKLLDELVRSIWVEATALSCGIVLILSMFMSLGTSLGLLEPMSTFQAVLAYNYFYLATYFAITAIRTPEIFTDPNLEAK